MHFKSFIYTMSLTGVFLKTGRENSVKQYYKKIIQILCYFMHAFLWQNVENRCFVVEKGIFSTKEVFYIMDDFFHIFKKILSEINEFLNVKEILIEFLGS